MPVIQFPIQEEDLPHKAGLAKCLSCQHIEMAVAPVFVEWMECSKCGLMESRYMDEEGIVNG